MSEKVKKEKKPSVFKKIGNFFKEVKVETFKRITRPNSKQVLNNSVVVIVTVVVVFVIVAVLDFVFNSSLRFALNDLPAFLSK